jgi:hypothetical protein
LLDPGRKHGCGATSRWRLGVIASALGAPRVPVTTRVDRDARLRRPTACAGRACLARGTPDGFQLAGEPMGTPVTPAHQADAAPLARRTTT